MPYGCKKLPLKETSLGILPSCWDLTEMQKSVIVYLRENGFSDLYVTAPEFRFLNNSPHHHYRENNIDFGGDRTSLFEAWEFMRRKWPGKTILGVTYQEYGWNTPLHLHIGGTWNQNLYAHGFEVKQERDENGYLLRTPATIMNNNKSFNEAYWIARKVYGYNGKYIIPISKPDPDNKSGMAVAGAFIGYAYGYATLGPKKSFIYAAGGAATGWILDKIRDALPGK